MGAHLHGRKLLALAVFVNSLKTAYVRSVHLYGENVGSLCTIQQLDCLLDPGKYTRVFGPVILGSFHIFLSSAGLKQTMDTIIKIRQNEGWHCVLEFRRDSPSEIVMPCILTPSKNPDLKDISSLELDLKVVEGFTTKSRSLNVDGKSATRTYSKAFSRPSFDLALSYPSDSNSLEHLNNGISGLMTSERIPCQQFDIWQNWGSELELARPNASLTRVPLSDQGHNAASPWSPTMTLDLNLDLRESSPKDNDDPDCSLLLSTPALDLKPLHNVDLEMPSLSLQQSSVTDDSTDFSALDSFADSPSSYKNMSTIFPNTRLVTFSAMQNARSLCSEEDSVGCHESVISAPTSDAIGNLSTTSSALYPVYDENGNGRMNSKLLGSSSTTSGNVCSIEYCSYDVNGHGKPFSTRVGSSGMEQTMRRWGHDMDGVKNKPGIARPGTTSQRITEVTLHELSQCFSMPINQAAKKLNVGLTVLKKRCREFNIPRWPHRKMKSINCLIGNIQDLAEEQGVTSSPRVLNVVRELEEQRKLMEERPGAALAERTKRLRQACFKVNYKKRRLGMISSNNNINNDDNADGVNIYTPGRLSSSSVSRPFRLSDLTDSPPRSCLTMDHFL